MVVVLNQTTQEARADAWPRPKPANLVSRHSTTTSRRLPEALSCTHASQRSSVKLRGGVAGLIRDEHERYNNKYR